MALAGKNLIDCVNDEKREDFIANSPKFLVDYSTANSFSATKATPGLFKVEKKRFGLGPK